MNRRKIAMLGVAALLILGSKGSTSSADLDLGSIDDMGTGAKIDRAMAGEHAKADRLYYAHVCKAVADRVDSRRRSDNKHVLAGRIQAETLIANMGVFAREGLKGSYPDLGNVITEHFAAFPKAQGEMTLDDRAELKRLLLSLAKGFQP